MPTTSYDALIIGTGQAGSPLAYALGDAGRRVAIVENAYLGGSCVNYGCAPTKMILASAQRAHAVRTAHELGVEAAEPVIDFKAIMARRGRLTQEARDGIENNLTQEHANTTLLHGHAQFTAPNSLLVSLKDGGEQALTAPLIFINTGTRPAVPDIPGLAEAGYLTNESLLLGLDELPEHLIILGGSYIGVEFGQMFRRLGSRVTIVDTEPQLMAHEDADVSQPLHELLTAEGVEIVLGAMVRHASRNAEGVLTLTVDVAGGSERRLRGTHLLVATGRTPNTDGLGLDTAGIDTDEDGYVVANEQLHTTARGVYALGDVKGGPQFTHLSYDDYRVVRDNLLHHGQRTTEGRPLPYVVFTEPQLGRVGLSKEQAKEQKIPFRVSRLPASTIGRAVETGNTAGFVEVLVSDEDQLLGAAVFCEQGGEIMTMFQLAMTGKLRYQELENLIIAHPTWAEVLNNAFQQLTRVL